MGVANHGDRLPTGDTRSLSVELRGSDPVAVQLPAQIGPYRVLGPIGRGGMGSVVRAQHVETDVLYAIKTVSTPTARTVASIRREIRSLARIRHPGIVRIYDEGVEGGLPWYAMELVPGNTLRAFTPRSRSTARPASSATSASIAADAAAPAGGRPVTAALTLYSASGLEPSLAIESWLGATHAAPAGAPLVEPSDDAASADTLSASDFVAGGDYAPEPSSWIGGMPPLGAIERGELPPAAGGNLHKLLLLVRRLCAPLAYLHGEGLVHCDLKPSNVLVRQTGQPVLVDFGVTAHFAGRRGREALDVRRAFTGTAAYMSPEQLRGELLDARADLYSLGCILYELVTGRVPFLAATPLEVGRAHLSRDPLPPSLRVSGVPAVLDDLILRLLAKDPQQRIGYAGDVAAMITEVTAAAQSDIYGPDGPPARPYLYRPRLSGRRDVMLALSAALDRVAAGGLVLIGGESGVGKTRVAVELAQRAEERGMHVLTGECTAPGHQVASFGDTTHPGEAGSGPLHPLRRTLQAIADLCRDLCRDPDRGGVPAAAAIVGDRAGVLSVFEPSLAQLPELGAVRRPDELPADAARARLFRALTDTLRAVAARTPTVLILDDLQWADELSLAFLSHWVELPARERGRLLIAATYRAEEVGSELAGLLAHADPDSASDAPGQVGVNTVSRVDLGRLGRRDVGAMIGSMLALPASPPTAYVRHIHHHSEGNPFFVAELLRAAVDEGMLFRDFAGRWRVTGTPDAIEEALGALPLPRSLRDAVERRLARVPDECRALLDIAAVAGPDIDVQIAARVTGLEPVAIGDMAQTLIRHQVLVERERDRLGFAHDKLREVAYHRLGPGDRAWLHSNIAQALTADGPPAEPELAARLGYHYGLGGNPTAARESFLAAARMTTARYAHDDAEHLYRTALAYFDEPDADAVRARRELAVDVLHLSGKNREALAELDSALSESRTVTDVGEEGWCLLGAATVRRTIGPLPEAEGLARRALALLQRVGDTVGEGRALTALGSTLWESGDLAAARPAYERALAVQRRAGDDRALGQTMSNLGSVLWDLGEEEAGRQLFTEALANLRAHGNRRWEGVTLFNLAWGYLTAGDYDAARDTAEEALVVLRETGDRRFESVTLVLLAMILVERGLPRNARSLCDQALAIQDDIGDRTARLNTLVALASIERRVRGDYDAASALLDEAEAFDDELGISLDAAYCKVERGHLEIARGHSGAGFLASAREIGAECGASSSSDLTGFVNRLATAQDAFERGEPLVRGEAVSSLSPGLAQWLEEIGALPSAE